MKLFVLSTENLVFELGFSGDERTERKHKDFGHIEVLAREIMASGDYVIDLRAVDAQEYTVLIGAAPHPCLADPDAHERVDSPETPRLEQLGAALIAGGTKQASAISAMFGLLITKLNLDLWFGPCDEMGFAKYAELFSQFGVPVGRYTGSTIDWSAPLESDCSARRQLPPSA